MNSNYKKFWSITLVVVMLFSAIGIAQVSHFCNLSQTEIGSDDCASSSAENHPCCESVPLAGDLNSGDDCCSDLVKYYQSEIKVILKEDIKISSIAINTLLVLNLSFLNQELVSAQNFSDCHLLPPDYFRTPIIISVQSFLI